MPIKKATPPAAPAATPVPVIPTPAPATPPVQAQPPAQQPPVQQPVAPVTTTTTKPLSHYIGIALIVAIIGLIALGVFSLFRPQQVVVLTQPTVVAPTQPVVVIPTATPLPTPIPPTAIPSTAIPPTPTAAAAPAQLPCPTTGEVKTLTGVDVQRIGTESCAFVWRGVTPATTIATCPLGFVCTFDVVNDVVVVHLGVNQTANIHAGTWRFIAAYPPTDAVHDVCSLYQKEKAFGLSEVPSFEVRFQPVTDGFLGPFGPQSCP